MRSLLRREVVCFRCFDGYDLAILDNKRDTSIEQSIGVLSEKADVFVLESTFLLGPCARENGVNYLGCERPCGLLIIVL